MQLSRLFTLMLMSILLVTTYACNKDFTGGEHGGEDEHGGEHRDGDKHETGEEHGGGGD